MIKINKYKWIPRHDAKEKVFAAMQPAIRFEKSDVLKSLPPMTHSNIEAGLSKQQTDMIKELKKEGALLLNNSTITVPNAAVMLSKVLQICAGAVKLDDGTSLPVDCGPRLAEMDRLIDGTSAKVIVLANWHAVVDLLVAHIGQKHGVVWIDGRVTGRARDEAIRKFQQDPSVKVLAAHPKTISHGLELSVADTQIWFGPTYSPEQMAQANERMASALQKNPMGIYYLASSRIEWRVFANVRGGLNLQASTMDLFREFVKESISEEA